MRLPSFLVLAIITTLLSACVISDEQYDASRYKKAIRELDSSKTAIDRWYSLGPAAKESFDQREYSHARIFALELKTKTPQYRGNWNYGNAIQDYNVVLGRLSLREGDIKSAERYLLAAGDSPGSPQMDSFGPNTSLARDLAAKGHSQVVIEYFAKVRRFWAHDLKRDPLDRYHAEKLDRWTKELRHGHVPDFGPNLIY